MSKGFYVRVYRPAVLFELEVEVDPATIGMENERDVHDTAPMAALRKAIREVQAGEVEGQTVGLDTEYVALIHDEDTAELTTVQLLGGVKCSVCGDVAPVESKIICETCH